MYYISSTTDLCMFPGPMDVIRTPSPLYPIPRALVSPTEMNINCINSWLPRTRTNPGSGGEKGANVYECMCDIVAIPMRCLN